MDWTLFSATVGASGVVSGVASLIVQGYFQHRLDRTLQEYQIRFSHLYAQRARVIRYLYAKIVLAERALQRHIHPADGYKKEFEEAAYKSARVLNDYYVLNQLFLPDELVSKLEKLGQAI